MDIKRVGAVGFATAGATIPIFNRNQGNVEAPEQNWNALEMRSCA